MKWERESSGRRSFEDCSLARFCDIIVLCLLAATSCGARIRNHSRPSDHYYPPNVFAGSSWSRTSLQVPAESRIMADQAPPSGAETVTPVYVMLPVFSFSTLPGLLNVPLDNPETRSKLHTDTISRSALDLKTKIMFIFSLFSLRSIHEQELTVIHSP